MKILVLMDSVSRANGGIFEAERRLHQTLAAEHGTRIEVLGLEDAYSRADGDAWRPLQPWVARVRGPKAVGYSPALRQRLSDSEADLAYSVGLWKYPSWAMVQWSRKHRRPYVVAPHGMLDPWALCNSRWKKRLAALLFERAHLARANCLRALCESEARSIRQFGCRNPICLIPNGVDVPASPVPGAPPWAGRAGERRKVLLYLGRIHPKKGLAPLLMAWAALQRRNPAGAGDWSLAIAGWGEGAHEQELQALAAQRGVGATVHFLGPQFGDAKTAACQQADAFVLPSLSEGLPMVVLEAWACGKPVLMTPECNLPEGFAAGAAIRVEAREQDLADGLFVLVSMSKEARVAMGAAGLRLVKDRFNWQHVANQMITVWRWVLGDCPAPACVRFD